MAEVKGFRSALFIDTKARRTAVAAGTHSWRANVAQASFLAKAALLLANLPLVAALLDPWSQRGAAVLACTLVFVLRVLAQMTCENIRL